MNRAGLPTVALAFAVIGVAGCAMDAQTPPDDDDDGVVASSSRSAITNGEPSADPAYVINIDGCTGSVITPHYILTAAHCFGGAGAFNVNIRTGMTSATLSVRRSTATRPWPTW